mmetsp:Transcript_32919/g.96937  ORF Transcript_32919/g.96937 Transcript_32919/m.96937 type:complete len:335 (+) Transcript_32919:318-1322(+)
MRRLCCPQYRPRGPVPRVGRSRFARLSFAGAAPRLRPLDRVLEERLALPLLLLLRRDTNRLLLRGLRLAHQPRAVGGREEEHVPAGGGLGPVGEQVAHLAVQILEHRSLQCADRVGVPVRELGAQLRRARGGRGSPLREEGQLSEHGRLLGELDGGVGEAGGGHLLAQLHQLDRLLELLNRRHTERLVVDECRHKLCEHALAKGARPQLLAEGADGGGHLGVVAQVRHHRRGKVGQQLLHLLLVQPLGLDADRSRRREDREADEGRASALREARRLGHRGARGRHPHRGLRLLLLLRRGEAADSRALSHELDAHPRRRFVRSGHSQERTALLAR